jgi:hypothetical protein
MHDDLPPRRHRAVLTRQEIARRRHDDGNRFPRALRNHFFTFFSAARNGWFALNNLGRCFQSLDLRQRLQGQV